MVGYSRPGREVRKWSPIGGPVSSIRIERVDSIPYRRAIDGFCSQVEARRLDAGEIGIELPAGQERKGCIARFIEHLIDAGVMAPPSPAAPPAPGSLEDLSLAYGDWLRHQRGLSPKTVFDSAERPEALPDPSLRHGARRPERHRARRHREFPRFSRDGNGHAPCLPGRKAANVGLHGDRPFILTLTGMHPSASGRPDPETGNKPDRVRPTPRSGTVMRAGGRAVSGVAILRP